MESGAVDIDPRGSSKPPDAIGSVFGASRGRGGAPGGVAFDILGQKESRGEMARMVPMGATPVAEGVGKHFRRRECSGKEMSTAF